MKKILTMVLTLLSIPAISNAEENIELNITRDSKTQWTLSVALNNETTYGGFQMDFVLPQQFSADAGSIQKATRMKNITTEANVLASGNLRIVGYGATNKKNITGTSGEIFSVKLTCAAAPLGEHRITVKNIRFSDTSTEVVLPGTGLSFSVDEWAQYNVNYWNGETLFWTVSVDEGGSIPEADVPDAAEGFTFCGWSDSTAVMPAHDLDIHATWCRQSFTVSYTVNGSTVHSESVAYGDPVKLFDYTPDEAHVFIKWIGDSYETMPAHDISYEAQLALLGDVDLDGQINSSDVVSIYNYIINGESSGILEACADINGDGTINSADVAAEYNLMTYGTQPASKAYRKALTDALK